MRNYKIRTFYISLFVIGNLFFGEYSIGAANDEKKENSFDVMKKILNHYYLDFKPIGKIELPRIFIYNGQLYAYLSTASAIAPETPFTDNYYYCSGTENNDDEICNKVLKDYRLSESTSLSKPITYAVVTKTDGSKMDLDLSISSHLIYFWLGMGLVVWLAMAMTKRYRKGIGTKIAPKGAVQNLFEIMYIFVRDEVVKSVMPHQHVNRYMPYLATLFFAIAFMNLLGLMPWGVSSTADITVTASLSIITFFVIQFSGNKHYWQHVTWNPEVPLAMRPIFAVIETISLFIKPFALAIRLFANMISGKLLVYSLLGMIFIFANRFGEWVGYTSSGLWVGFTVFIYILKTFIALLQAYIFTFLSAIFIGMAVEDGEHANHDVHTTS